MVGLDDDSESVIGASVSASASGSVSGATVSDELIWPSMQDLNTRLRRVITSYQRNYKKEELKQQQKAKVSHSTRNYSSYNTTIDRTIYCDRQMFRDTKSIIIAIIFSERKFFFPVFIEYLVKLSSYFNLLLFINLI